MDAYLTPASLAYILTGLSVVAESYRLGAVQAPLYVRYRSMRILAIAAWPFIRPGRIFIFALFFLIFYLLYIAASIFIDNVYLRFLFTAISAVPTILITSLAISFTGPFISIAIVAVISFFSRDDDL